MNEISNLSDALSILIQNIDICDKKSIFEMLRLLQDFKKDGSITLEEFKKLIPPLISKMITSTKK